MRSGNFCVLCALVSQQKKREVLCNCRIAGEGMEWKRDGVCVLCLFAYIQQEDPSFE